MDDGTDIFKRIKRLEQDLLGFKSAQPIGTDSVVVYQTMSNNIWDYEGQLPPSSFSGFTESYVSFSVIFTARDQQSPFGRVRAFVANGDGTPINYNSNQGSASNPTEITLECTDDIFGASSAQLADSRVLRYQVRIKGAQYTNFKVKFAVDATDTGRLQATVSRAIVAGSTITGYEQVIVLP